MTETQFIIGKPVIDTKTASVQFPYRLGDLSFTEKLEFAKGADIEAMHSPVFLELTDLTACVLGVSYFKLLAPHIIAAPEIALDAEALQFVLDVYENGLGEFYARNNLQRFGKLKFDFADKHAPSDAAISLPDRILVPIGGGKDSLVSVQLLETAGVDFTPFAVNPKGPILSSVEEINKTPVYVKRTLDKEMIRLGKEPGYYNGHVPSTAIISMIAALSAVLFGYNRIALSNERSASEGNVEFDGRQANHQHSKSVEFERLIANVLRKTTGGALQYFSLLRPYSEARIAALFARETRFDKAFSSCNRNFKLFEHDGPLWCGECPKCHFVFLILAPVMDKERLLSIFGRNLLDVAGNAHAYRELTGLAGQKPWECVGEILEAAACLWVLTDREDWKNDTIVSKLKTDLVNQYGIGALNIAYEQLHIDADEHLIPDNLFSKVISNAL